MNKKIIVFVIGLILGSALLLLIFFSTLSSYDGYVVDKISTDKIWVVPADSFDEAKETRKENSEAGMIFIDMNEKKVSNINVGQKVKVYHGNRVYASAPGRVKPLIILDKK